MRIKKLKAKKLKKGKVKQLKTSKAKNLKPKEAAKPKIIDFSIFYDGYIPQKIVSRETQKASLEEAIKTFIKTGYSKNLLLSGITGTGKTSTLKNILTKIDPKYYLFVSCKNKRDIRGIMAEVGGIKLVARDTAETINPRVAENVKKARKIFIFDDITSIPNYDLLADFLNNLWRETSVPVFITTNNQHFLNDIPDDALASMNFRTVPFLKYDSYQMLEIIQERLAIIKQKLPLATLKWIAAESAHSNGSARKALDLAKTALMTGKTSIEDMEKEVKELEKENYFNTLSGLASTDKKVLRLIINRYVSAKAGVPIKDIAIELSLSLGRISQVITSLNSNELLIMKKDGNSKLIEPEPYLLKIQEKDNERLMSLLI